MDDFLYDFMLCAPQGRYEARVARRLAASITHYKLPKGAVSGAPSHGRILPDTADAPLDDGLRAALAGCRFMVLLCSPRTKASPAIAQKLEYFARIRGKANIIAVLVQGEPVDSFPAFFIEQKQVQHTLADGTVQTLTETVEPIASDLRGQSTGQRRRALAYETVRIVATLVGLHPDVLVRRHEKRRRRRLWAITGAVGGIFLAVAAIFGVLGGIAAREGRIAHTQAEMGAQMVQRLFTQLPQQFAAVPGAAPYVSGAILDGLDGLYNQDIERLDDVDLEDVLAAAKGDSAELLLRKGALRRRLGHTGAALALYQAGAESLPQDGGLLLQNTALLLESPLAPAGYAQYVLQNRGENTEVQAGDLLLSLGGRSFSAYDSFTALAGNALAGTRLQVILLRPGADGTLKSVEAVLSGADLAALMTAVV